MHDDLTQVIDEGPADRSPPDTATAPMHQTDDARSLCRWLTCQVAAQREVSPEEIDVRAPLAGFGLDSIAIFGITGELAERLGRELPATLLWDHPTIEALAAHLAGSAQKRPESA